MSSADELQVFRNVALQANPSNDGDSFQVELGRRVCVIRLYFVDCPEATAKVVTDARRLREQARYFGLSSTKTTADYGRKATTMTAKLLAKPFAVHTAFASAPGRSQGGRYYAFVTTPDGRDLGEVLVGQGLARNYGLGRGTPGGLSRQEAKARLSDLEVAAMIKREGIWRESEPDRIVELRAEQRRETEELVAIRKEAADRLPPGRLDINHATQRELQLLSGVGPVLAKRIVAARPFQDVDDLIRVNGIGAKTLELLRGKIKVKNN